MRCEECGQDFQPARVYSPTATNRPRFCSAVCCGRAYRKAKVQAIDHELARAEAAIQKTRAVLTGRSEKRLDSMDTSDTIVSLCGRG
jgi:hypothetical protein